MALKAIVSQDELNALDPMLQNEYAPMEGQEGAFLLSVESVKMDGSGGTPAQLFALEDIHGLKSAIERERQQSEKYEKLNKDFADLDPNKARDALQKVKEMSKWTPEQKVQEQIASITEQLESKHKKSSEEWEKKEAEYEKDINRLVVDAKFTELLGRDETKGAPQLLLPHIRERVKVVRGEDGTLTMQVLSPEGGPMISRKTGNNGPMGPDELLEEMMRDPAYAPAFYGSGASGSGGRGDGAMSHGSMRKLTPQDGHDAYKRAKEEAKEKGIDFFSILPEPGNQQ